MLHMLLIPFVGKYCVYMECQRLLTRTVTSSSLATFGRPYAASSESSYFSPRRTIHKPTAKRKLPTAHSLLYFEYSSRRTSRSGRSVYLSPSCPTTEQNTQQPEVPLRGRLRIQAIVPIGHSSSTTPRAHQFGRKCTSDTSQEGASRYKKHHRAPSTMPCDQAQLQQVTYGIQHRRSHVATPSQGPLAPRTQVQTSTMSGWTLQGAQMLQPQLLQDRPPPRQVQRERHLQRQRPLAFPW